eukprot:PhF_6_TR10360/c0_g1_i2/m.16050
MQEFGLLLNTSNDTIATFDLNSVLGKYVTQMVLPLHTDMISFSQFVDLYAEVLQERVRIRELKSQFETTKLAQPNMPNYEIVNHQWKQSIESELEGPSTVEYISFAFHGFHPVPLKLRTAPSAEDVAAVTSKGKGKNATLSSTNRKAPMKGKENAHNVVSKSVTPPGDQSHHNTSMSLICIPLSQGEREVLDVYWSHRLLQNVKVVSSFTPTINKVMEMFDIASLEGGQQGVLTWDDAAELLPPVFGTFNAQTMKFFCKNAADDNCTQALFQLTISQLVFVFDNFYKYEVVCSEFPLDALQAVGGARRLQVTIPFLELVVQRCGVPSLQSIMPKEEDLHYFFPQDSSKDALPVYLTLAQVVQALYFFSQCHVHQEEAVRMNSIPSLLCLAKENFVTSSVNDSSVNALCDLFGIDTRVPMEDELPLRSFIRAAVFLRLSKYAVVGVTKTTAIMTMTDIQYPARCVREIIEHFLSLLTLSGTQNPYMLTPLVNMIAAWNGLNPTDNNLPDIQYEKLIHSMILCCLKAGKFAFQRYLKRANACDLLFTEYVANSQPVLVDVEDIGRCVAATLGSVLNDEIWISIFKTPDLIQSWLESLSPPYPRNIKFQDRQWFDIYMVMMCASSGLYYFKSAPRHVNPVEHIRQTTSRLHVASIRLSTFVLENFTKRKVDVIPLETFMTFLKSSSVLTLQTRDWSVASSYLWWYTHNSEMMCPDDVSSITCQDILSKLCSLYEDVGVLGGDDVVLSSGKFSWTFTTDSMKGDAEQWLRVLHRVRNPVIHTMLRVVPAPTTIDTAIHWFATSSAIHDVANGKFSTLQWMLSLRSVHSFKQSIGSEVVPEDDIILQEVEKSQRLAPMDPWCVVMDALYTTYLGGRHTDVERVF